MRSLNPPLQQIGSKHARTLEWYTVVKLAVTNAVFAVPVWPVIDSKARKPVNTEHKQVAPNLLAAWALALVGSTKMVSARKGALPA